MADCDICRKPLEGEDLVFAEDQQQHPGYLGLLDPACYSKVIDAEPLLSWTDPISGEIDYRSASEDLDIDDGSDEEEW